MATLVPAVVVQGIELHDLESKNEKSSRCRGKSNRLGVEGACAWLRPSYRQAQRLTVSLSLAGLSCPACRMNPGVHVRQVG